MKSDADFFNVHETEDGSCVLYSLQHTTWVSGIVIVDEGRDMSDLLIRHVLCFLGFDGRRCAAGLDTL